MITKPHQRIRQEKTNARGGDGTVVFEQFLDGDHLPAHFQFFSEIVLEPGTSIGDHVHTGEAEVFYVLEGEGCYNNNGVQEKIFAGDVTVCFDGEMHGVKNCSDRPLRAVAAVIQK